MFLIGGKPMRTWNCFVGCFWNCTYCNARKAAETRFKHLERYRDGFTPKLIERELRRQFNPGEFVFIAYMGDISFATIEIVQQILARVQMMLGTSFLFLTKDPAAYRYWQEAGGVVFPDHVYLGTTIESNQDYGVSKAPEPAARAFFLAQIPHSKKFISIEPVMDFDLEVMTRWMLDISPDIIEVGADNYHNNLEEPPPAKLRALLRDLRKISPVVVEKPGLERLLDG
jgi:protein gp37